MPHTKYQKSSSTKKTYPEQFLQDLDPELAALEPNLLSRGSEEDSEDQQYDAAQQLTVSMAVPEMTVPAVIGTGGAVLRDIMARSGADVRVSQRGEFVPGTSNR